MKHVVAARRDGREMDDSAERGLIHYDGVGIVGTHTLCGHVDQVQWDWAETTKRVNCRGCIGVRNHVRGR